MYITDSGTAIWHMVMPTEEGAMKARILIEGTGRTREIGDPDREVIGDGRAPYEPVVGRRPGRGKRLDRARIEAADETGVGRRIG